MEELEGERSRLEQEKQALEMQMERLTLQVGDGLTREMCLAQPLLLPGPMNETPDFFPHIHPYLAENYCWVLHGPVPSSGSLSFLFLLFSTDLSFSSLRCCPSSLPFPCGHDLHCYLHWTVFFLVFFLLIILLMARSPQVRDCPASRQAIDFYLGTY